MHDVSSAGMATYGRAGADEIGCAAAEILVELKFHATFSVGTGMTHSRAASAPYAIAAKTFSWVSPGYWSSSSVSVMSSARKSRMSETQIRVPFMQGLPPQILGSMEIVPEEGSCYCLRKTRDTRSGQLELN